MTDTSGQTVASAPVTNELESIVNTIVAKAKAIVTGVEGAVELVVDDLETFFDWLMGLAPAITTGVQIATGLVGEMKTAGVELPPEAEADLADINAAVAGLNAAANASNSGANPAQAVLDGYVAAKNIVVATASLSASLGKAAPAPPAAS